MKLFLPHINFSEQLDSDTNIVSFLFKLILIFAIALLVHFLIERNHSATVFHDQGNAVPEILTAGPPVPY